LKQHWRKTCLEEDTVLLETEERVAAAGEENVRKQHNVIGNAMRSTKYRAAVLDPKSG